MVPAWRRDLLNPGLRELGAVTVTRGPNFAFGTPVMLRRPFRLSPPEQQRAFDVTSDGRFLARVPADQALTGAPAGASIQMVLNWFDELLAEGSRRR